MNRLLLWPAFSQVAPTCRPQHHIANPAIAFLQKMLYLQKPAKCGNYMLKLMLGFATISQQARAGFPGLIAIRLRLNGKSILIDPALDNKPAGIRTALDLSLTY